MHFRVFLTVKFNCNLTIILRPFITVYSDGLKKFKKYFDHVFVINIYIEHAAFLTLTIYGAIPSE